MPAITDWLLRTVQPQLSTLDRRAAGDASRAGARSPCASGSTPTAWPRSTSRPATCRRRCGATTTWPPSGQTKGNLVQVNLLANTDLRSVEEFEDLIVADRGGAIVRLSDVARVELGAEEADLVAKYNEQEGVYLGVWPLVGANEIEVAHRLREEMERIRPTLPKDIDMRLVYDGDGVHAGRAEGDHQDAGRDDR